MNALLEQIARFGVMRLTAVFGLTAGAAVALVFFVSAMNGDGEALLYSGLEPQDAAAVTTSLDQAGIRYTLREGGSAVYVASGQVDEARVRVAQEGPLSFGSVGYEIFDETDALGTTEFVQNINAKRALEGELARSLQALDVVASARVHLVLPERRLFSRETEQPSASVIVETLGPLTPGSVATIRNLVSTAVAGLEPTQITIADGSGRLLASPADGDSASAAALDDRRASFENDLQRKIREVVEGVVGPGAARVVVSADLARESLSRSRTIFDPEGQVLRSQSTEETQESSSETEPLGGVSASENLPEADGAEEPSSVSTRNMDSTREERNFEISRTDETMVREAGDVRRLSVAVVVDHVATPQVGEDGQPVLDETGQPVMTYAPRPAEEIDEIERLVQAAMGYVFEEPTEDARDVRQDRLTVTQMRFNRLDPRIGTPAAAGFDIGRLDFMRIAEIVVLFLTVLMIIFLVARPLVKGVLGEGGMGTPALAGAGVGASAAMLPAGLPDEGGGDPSAIPEITGPDGAPERVDIARIDGAVKKSSIKKVSEIVQDHPDETMSILRNWMHES